MRPRRGRRRPRPPHSRPPPPPSAHAQPPVRNVGGGVLRGLQRGRLSGRPRLAGPPAGPARRVATRGGAGMVHTATTRAVSSSTTAVPYLGAPLRPTLHRAAHHQPTRVCIAAPSRHSGARLTRRRLVAAAAARHLERHLGQLPKRRRSRRVGRRGTHLVARAVDRPAVDRRGPVDGARARARAAALRRACPLRSRSRSAA